MFLTIVLDPALWSCQHANRLPVLGAAENNVGLPVREAVVALIDQNLCQSLALCFVRGDGIAQCTVHSTGILGIPRTVLRAASTAV
eukprot:COSAG05_NODE_7493_length_806_cov_1.519149_2_plen_85_part_01